MGHDLIRRGLKLSHLRLVAALARSGQIGTAAALVGLTQPAASRLLADVERITGRAVHVRDGRGVRLTDEGSALAARAARILTELDDAGREIAEIGSGAAGHVRLGSVTGPALDRVLPALRAARLSAPGITAEVEVAPSDTLGDMLLAGRLDFSLARLPQGRDAALFDLVPLGDEPVSLMTRQGHALARGGPVLPAKLMAYDWVMPGPGTILHDTVLARLRALGLGVPRGRLATSSFLLILALLQNSNAIAPLADAVVAQFASSPDSPYARLQVDLGIRVAPYGMMTRAGTRLTPTADRLAALIRGTTG